MNAVPSPVVSEVVAAKRRRDARFVAELVGKYGALLALLILVVVFTIASPEYFLTPDNLLQILNQSALTAIVAGGLTVILASGHFDLSVGYQVSLSGIIVTKLMLSGTPVFLAILAALGAGLVIGVVNGFIVTRLEVNALVATLGTGSVLVGLNYLISSGTPQAVASEFRGFLSISIGDWFGVPRPVYYMAVVMVLLWILLNTTDVGRGVRAVGGNSEAARLAGVPVERVTTVTFVAAGVCSSIAGVLLASSIGSGQPTGGDAFTLSSFAAAFLGSAVLREGQFHIIGTLVGVITVAVGFNGLALIGVPSFAQFLFQGLLLIAAVAFSSVGRRLSRT